MSHHSSDRGKFARQSLRTEENLARQAAAWREQKQRRRDQMTSPKTDEEGKTWVADPNYFRPCYRRRPFPIVPESPDEREAEFIHCGVGHCRSLLNRYRETVNRDNEAQLQIVDSVITGSMDDLPETLHYLRLWIWRFKTCGWTTTALEAVQGAAGHNAEFSPILRAQQTLDTNSVNTVILKAASWATNAMALGRVDITGKILAAISEADNGSVAAILKLERRLYESGWRV